MLLEEGMNIEKIGIPPNDSQFLESRQFQITDIARWFNLPVHKLKEMTKSSFNNIESEQQSFVIDSLLPWSVRLEQNYNMQLLKESEFRSGLYFKHVFEGLLRGNSKDRSEFYSKLWGIGALSVNDIREKEDLDPVDGGDIHLVPLNMTTLENAGQAKEEPQNILPQKDEEDEN
jgi:HK97 family phage portal protein